ncbi:hypothetical protein OSTOST_09592, partial [Ostertagia ostertagi]
MYQKGGRINDEDKRMIGELQGRILKHAPHEASIVEVLSVVMKSLVLALLVCALVGTAFSCDKFQKYMEMFCKYPGEANMCLTSNEYIPSYILQPLLQATEEEKQQYITFMNKIRDGQITVQNKDDFRQHMNE